MALFRFRIMTRQQVKSEGDTDEAHPGFRLGKQLGHSLNQMEHQLANRLNQEQHSIGFYWRNVLLAAIGAFFLLYFIALLTQ